MTAADLGHSDESNELEEAGRCGRVRPGEADKKKKEEKPDWSYPTMTYVRPAMHDAGPAPWIVICVKVHTHMDACVVIGGCTKHMLSDD